MTTVLGYWNFRGAGHPIRLLLEYVGAEYTDKRYNVGTPPDIGKEWFAEKFSLGIDLPNLPYFLHGDVNITQANAIMRHIGRQHDMVGNTEGERIRCDMILDLAVDFTKDFSALIMSSNYETEKEAYLKTLPGKLQQIETFIGDGPWFAGDKLTIADFRMYPALDWFRLWIEGKDCLKPCSNLRAFMDKFEAQESIKKYMESDRYLAKPVFTDWHNHLFL